MNRLIARNSRELAEKGAAKFYVPAPVDDDNLNKSVTDNLDGIQSTMLNMYDEMTKKFADIQDFINKLEPFPVGSTFISPDDINPFVKLGYGNWVLISEGRTLVGAGAGKVLGAVGGNYEVTLSESQMPSHKHDVTVSQYMGETTTSTNGGTKTTNEDGEHTHTTSTSVASGSGTSSGLGSRSEAHPVAIKIDAAGSHSHTVDINHNHTVDISHGHSVTETAKGSSAPINIESPYLVVNIWHRVS